MLIVYYLKLKEDNSYLVKMYKNLLLSNLFSIDLIVMSYSKSKIRKNIINFNKSAAFMFYYCYNIFEEK